MAKRAKKERIDQFIKDVELLTKKYDKKVMAEQLNMDPGNLSSYSTGSKPPGEQFLDKFYSRFEEELNKLRNEINSALFIEEVPTSKVEQSTAEYGRRSIQSDYIQTLKANNDGILVNLNIMAESNQILAKSNQTMSESNHILAVNNKNLVDRLLSLDNPTQPDGETI